MVYQNDGRLSSLFSRCKVACVGGGVFFILLVIILFHFLDGSSVLLTTDAAIKGANQSASEAISYFSAAWSDQVLLGRGFSRATQVALFLKALLAPVIWNNWVYSIACLFTAIGLLFNLSRKGLSLASGLLAGVVAVWLGSNFTLLYAGHTFKPYVVLFFVFSLISTERSARGSIPAALIWGSCVGLMFMQQPDVALFFALLGGFYLVFHLWQARGFKCLKWLKVLIPAAAIAFLFAAGPLLSGYTQHVKGTVQMQADDKQAKWDYVTQWSFPPEETIAFIAPGYTGWRSGEPEGPYWGRMGRSAGWEETRQGFQNFKLENTYLGVIPIVFALFALFSCRRSKHRAEIIFWGCATLVALLLAFGKFSPLYALFYKLPVVNNIRNPNKFLQVFQVCLAILTAYGFDAIFGQKPKIENRKSEDFDLRPPTSNNRRFFWGAIVILGGLVLWSLSSSMNLASGVAVFRAQGWPQEVAKTIVQNQAKALWHASFMAAVVAAVFALFSFPNLGKTADKFSKHWKIVIAAGLVLIVAADAVKLSKHYVKEMPRSYIESNALTDFLQKDLGHQRVALLSQQGIYGIWTTYLLPYNKISTFNFSDMPRMATDYKAFLEAGQRNPLNMWRFSAVKYLLGPTAVEKQLAGQARKVFVYDLASAGANEFRVVATPNGAHAVFELLNSSPRYAVVAPVDPMPDDQALAAVAKLPRPQAGSAEVISYRPGKVKLRVSSEAPSTLRVAEKWNADWKAEVDGDPAEVQRVDYLCQGVSLPAGEHEVELRYSPPKLFLYMQCAGYLILFGSLLAMFIRRKGDHASD